MTRVNAAEISSADVGEFERRVSVSDDILQSSGMSRVLTAEFAEIEITVDSGSISDDRA